MTDDTPLFEFKAQQDPYPGLARLRAVDPVHRSPDEIVVTRHADAVAVLRDPRFGKGDTEAQIQKAHGLGAERMYILPMMFSDPPDHTRLRSVVNRAFTLRIVEGLKPRIEAVTHQLLDAVAGRESFDLISALAYRVPIVTICHLLGMPEADHARIHLLSEAHAAAMASGGLRDETREVIQRAHRLRNEWAAYFRDLAEERRKTPGNDIISELVRIHDGTEKLTEYELLATIIGLLFAGHTTTADAIGSTVLTLLRHPEQWSLLVREANRLEGAVEEGLRWEPPIQAFGRVALHDADVAGIHVPKGTDVFVMAGGANRDPEVFTDPERFDITRDPNKHLSFGSGTHFCLGSTLARVQIGIVLDALRSRYPTLALKGKGENESQSEKPLFRRNFFFRGLTSLEVGPG